MHTKTQILKKLKYWRNAHGTVAVASAAGFVIGLTLATQTPHLQGVLLERVMEWRSVALQRQQHFTAPVTSQEGFVRAPAVMLAPVVLLMPAAEEDVTPAPVIPTVSVPPPVIQKPVAPILSKLPMQKPAPSEPATVSSPFPAFGHALTTVSKVPNWGGMHAAAEWKRSYQEMTDQDFVPVPSYDMQKLTTPFKDLLNPRDDAEITRKLFYSTHYFGKYDLDANEFTASHPGIDLKLAIGTPLGAIGGGRIHRVENKGPLGLHVIIEHRIGGRTYYSIYGHLGFASVKAGENVTPGQFIGTVGMTGNTSGAHVHLQVDIGHGEAVHEPYTPTGVPSPQEAARWVVNPITFIAQYK